jgi:hypothetical protein
MHSESGPVDSLGVQLGGLFWGVLSGREVPNRSRTDTHKEPAEFLRSNESARLTCCRICDDTHGQRLRSTVTLTGSIVVWTRVWGIHEQPSGLQEDDVCVPLSRGGARGLASPPGY